MDKPVAAEVRALLPNFPWQRYGYQAGGPNEAAGFTLQIDAAWAYVVRRTGRDLDALTDADLVAIAGQAVSMRVAQQLGGGGRSATASAVGNPWIKSFRAGSYSETRRDFSELRKAGLINSWLELAELLYLLATDDARDLWLEELGRPSTHAVLAERDFRSGWDPDAAYTADDYGDSY